MDAFLAGREQLAAAGGDPSRVRSVASFFVSRVDSKVDAAIEQRAAALPSGSAERAELESLRGKAAVANARLAYAAFEEVAGGARFAVLRAKGAHVQRPLWASTSTKNPAYRDVLYVEELIGPDTVNTMPLETIEAFQDHGRVAGDTVLDGVGEARQLLDDLASAGVDYDDVTATLEAEGVQKFSDSFDQIMDSVRLKRGALQAA